MYNASIAQKPSIQLVQISGSLVKNSESLYMLETGLGFVQIRGVLHLVLSG